MPITVISGTTPANTGQLATTASVTLTSASLANLSLIPSGSFILNGYNIVTTGPTASANTPTTIFVSTGSNFQNTLANIRDAINVTASAANSATDYADLQGVTSITGSNTITFRAGAVGQYVYPNVLQSENYVVSGSTTTYFSGASMYGPAGSGIVTSGGPWTTILATADALITVSGSVLGEATFLLPRGETYIAYVEGATAGSSVAGEIIQAITVVNPQGTVVAS
jgi:hypothetical protein